MPLLLACLKLFVCVSWLLFVAWIPQDGDDDANAAVDAGDTGD